MLQISEQELMQWVTYPKSYVANQDKGNFIKKAKTLHREHWDKIIYLKPQCQRFID